MTETTTLLYNDDRFNNFQKEEHEKDLFLWGLVFMSLVISVCTFPKKLKFFF